MDYTEIFSPENLFRAFDEFKKGKRKKKDVMEFERNIEENIFELSQELLSKKYKHGNYVRFHVWDPKFRIIHKALVRDRIVHHVVFQYLYAIFDKTFIFHSYSSRLDKGTHLGVENLYRMLRKESRNFTQNTYALKCDIRKYFASIDHEILLNLVFKKVFDEDMRHLIQIIIESYSTDASTHTHTHTHTRRGIPLGNMTSQIFANIYLHELDQFMKHTLKVKYYLRYADDFIIVHQNQNYLKNLIQKIENFLNSHLKIQLHPQKIQIRKFRQGIDFLGYICFPHHALIRTKTRKRMFQKLSLKHEEVQNGKIKFSSMLESLQSYWGVLKHANTWKIVKKMISTFMHRKT